MQVTITTDAGTFTADNLKEAKRLEAKAKREEAKRQKVESANYDAAKTQAEALAYRVMEWAFRADEGKLPRSWTYCHPNGEYPDAYLDDGYMVARLFVGGEYASGKREFFFRDKFIGYVSNAAGCMLIHVQWYGTETPVWLAVGISNGVLAYAEIPAAVGLKPERFRKLGQKESCTAA